jgi:hypothetical protein
MLTVLFSVSNDIFIHWLPSEGKFHSSYFCQQVLAPLAQIVQAGETTNCFGSCHVRHVSQPPYSPDVSLCEFFPFDDLKKKLKDEEFEMLEDPQGVERLSQVISINGDYVQGKFCECQHDLRGVTASWRR